MQTNVSTKPFQMRIVIVLRLPMHKVPVFLIEKEKKKAYFAVIVQTQQNMFVLRFHFAFTKSRSTASLFSFVLVL